MIKIHTIQYTPISETLLNKPITAAEKYFKSDFDKLTNQIEIDGEYYQLYIKNGIIVGIKNMKER